MTISFNIFRVSFRRARLLAIAATLCLPLVARADFASDAGEPLRLLQAKQFPQAVAALEKIAPRYQDQFALHYLLGLARMGSLSDKSKAAQAIQLLQQSRQSLLKAQQLAKNEEQKKETRELLTAAESGLRELGALPEKAAPKPAAKPAAAKAAVPKPPVVAKAPVLAAPTRRPGYVVGRVVDSAGKPMVGAEISIFGTTISGAQTRFETVSAAGGLFSQRVPDGIYGVRGEWKTRYNDKNYRFDLDPDDGKTGVVYDAAEGIVKNFHWKIAGLKPGQRAGEANTHTEGLKYYGGYLSVSVTGHGETGEVVYFPQGSTLVMTLTPRSALIDGSVGKPQVFRRAFERDETSNHTFTWYPSNIPIGLYTLTAQLVGADGTAQNLNIKRSLDFKGPFTAALPVNFEPDQFEKVQMIQITLEAPVAAAK